MKATLILAVGFLAGGCSTVQIDGPEEISGFYESIHGGFNEQLFLELKRDGAYTLIHISIGDVVEADGVFVNGSGGEDTGTWSLSDGILTLAASKIGTDRSPMFLPAYCDRFKVSTEKGSMVLTSILTPAIPAASPEKIVLRKNNDSDYRGTTISQRAAQQIVRDNLGYTPHPCG